MLSGDAIEALRGRLLAADYTLDAVRERLGQAGERGLERNSSMPALRALGDDDDPQATLMRLWLTQSDADGAAVARALGDLTPFLEAGLLARVGAGWGAGESAGKGPRVRALVEIRPYAAEGTDEVPPLDGWVCHDPIPNLDGRTTRTRGDFVLGVSPASTTLAQLSVRRPVGTALDLGTGCGVQTLHLAQHARRVVATDLNPRALALAAITTRLNRVAADLREGSLYEPVRGETFDQIVTNPPYVMSPPGGERLTYREGVLPGDDLVRRVITEGGALLNPEGTMQVLCNWAVVEGEPFTERLAGWVRPTGCDAWVLQRERLDPFEYVELWLADAGLTGTPEYDARYGAWLDYFASMGIVGVGMGWVSLRNAGRERPDLRVEEWPHAVHQPIGKAFAAQQRAVDLVQRSDTDLLATRWRTLPGVSQETLGRPGAEDPEHLVLRQSFGVGRALQADTGLAALVGACDGDLRASEIIGAIASLLDLDADALAAELTPRLRDMVADGYLVDAEQPEADG